MKFSIMGFSQEKLKELELDLTDSLILRWFVDFKDSGSMATEIFEDDKYYWIKYEYLLQEIPIININNKKTLGRRLKDLTDKGILKQYIKKKGGIFTLYTLGDKYKLLISNHLVTQKSQGYALESHKGSDSKVTTKDSSIKDSSIKVLKTNTLEIENFFCECWELYPNKKGKGQIKSSTKNKVYKLGEEFKRCIQRYKEDKEEWKQWQNGSTFFNSGYADYLDEAYEIQKVIKAKTYNKNSIALKTKEQKELEDLLNEKM